MEFNYLVERTRMLNSLGRRRGRCEGVPCEVCPLWNNAVDRRNCTWFEGEHPIEATEIVRKWAEEHPKRTRKDVLLDKFPNAKMNTYGIPCVCVENLGFDIIQCTNYKNYESCIDCWNTEVEE